MSDQFCIEEENKNRTMSFDEQQIKIKNNLESVKKTINKHSVEAIVNSSKKRKLSENESRTTSESPIEKRSKSSGDVNNCELQQNIESKTDGHLSPRLIDSSLSPFKSQPNYLAPRPLPLHCEAQNGLAHQKSEAKSKQKKRYDPRYPLPEKPRQKRAVIQDMVRPLKKWLLRHRHNPYPTKAEKVQLAIGSNMTLVQVSNWFANARRRLKNVVQEQHSSWSRRLRLYNQFVQGNAELLSISSNDSIWNSDDEDDGKCNFDESRLAEKDESLRVDSEDSEIDVLDEKHNTDCDNKSPDPNSTSKYKKSILHRYLADSVESISKDEAEGESTPPPGRPSEPEKSDVTKSDSNSKQLQTSNSRKRSTANHSVESSPQKRLKSGETLRPNFARSPNVLIFPPFPSAMDSNGFLPGVQNNFFLRNILPTPLPLRCPSNSPYNFLPMQPSLGLPPIFQPDSNASWPVGQTSPVFHLQDSPSLIPWPSPCHLSSPPFGFPFMPHTQSTSSRPVHRWSETDAALTLSRLGNPNSSLLPSGAKT